MRPRLDPDLVRRALAGGLVLVPLLALGVALGGAFAATRPRVENPHGRFHAECDLCHGPEGWKPARVSSKFDHGKFGFRLEGAHAAAACTGCHASLDFSSSSMQCASCHQDPHRGEMGIDCARCHSARSFVDRGPMVRAHQLTRFPLTGSHAGLDCESCHPPAAQGRLQFVNTQAECRGCHMNDFRAAKEPDHVAGGFSTECQTCHSAVTWTGTRGFDHQRTGFPLTGAHVATACTSCHPGQRFQGTPKDCYSCHRTDYDQAQPPHAASGFASSACASCHNTTSFAGASFNHDATAFPLTGAHRSVACAGCHGDGVFSGKLTTCESCHMADYNAAVPNHPAAGFTSAACASCHNTTTFTGATFNHDSQWFRIYNNGHAGRWNACTDCHPSTTTFSAFNCLGCHPHDDKASTDSRHAGKSGYRYDSNACYSCHTR